MLETATLWLSAPTTAWPPGLPRTGRCLRHVLAADSRELLGHVAVTPGRWWPWPTGRRVATYEGPDVSLLFSARRTGWAWPVTVVAEADGNTVALVYGRTVACATRRFQGRCGTAGDWRAGTFVNRTGLEVARWEVDGAGTNLHFLAEIRSEPFVKMGIMAAILMFD